jgi:hypothetical protein
MDTLPGHGHVGEKQEKGAILQSWNAMGGIVKDFPDGSTHLYPYALFKMVVIEESSIILCNKAPA